MCSLENFIICPSDEHDQFLELSMVVLKLDRRDFEGGYEVDEAEHPRSKKIEGPIARVAAKGKKKAKEFEVPLCEGSARPITIGSDDEEPAQMRECEDMGAQLPITPRAGHGSSSLLSQGHERGFSDSSLPDCSPPAKMKQVKKDSTESVLEKMMLMQVQAQAQHKLEVAEILAREREERRAEREEDRRADAQKWEMTTKMLASVVEMMPSLVAKSIESYHARPLLMHDPTQSGQLLLPQMVSHSSGSGAARHSSPGHSPSGLLVDATVPPAPTSRTVLPVKSDSKSDDVPSPQNLNDVEMDVHEEEEDIGRELVAKVSSESEPGSTP